MTKEQRHTLSVIDRGEPVSRSQVRARLDIPRSSCDHRLARLVKSGHLSEVNGLLMLTELGLAARAAKTEGE